MISHLFETLKVRMVQEAAENISLVQIEREMITVTIKSCSIKVTVSQRKP